MTNQPLIDDLKPEPILSDRDLLRDAAIDAGMTPAEIDAMLEEKGL